MTTAYKVAIARFPGDGSECTECVSWLIRTVCAMKADPRISEVIECPARADTPITMMRNKAVLDARKAGADYLLMVDSDMVPDAVGPKPFWPTAWEFLMARRAGAETLGSFDGSDLKPPATIAAPYGGAPPAELVMVLKWTDSESDGPSPTFRLELVPRQMIPFCKGIEEVGALATGLILYDMRVFDVLPPPWFEYEWADPPFNSVKASTEDVYQTRNASMLGLPQYVAWDCWAGHKKAKVVGKPSQVTADQVHRSLVEAVLRGAESDDALVVLPPAGEDAPVTLPVD